VRKVIRPMGNNITDEDIEKAVEVIAQMCTPSIIVKCDSIHGCDKD